MRKFLIGSAAVWLVFLSTSCATVPDGAPKEFQLAYASIQRAESGNVDAKFPETLKRAKRDLKTGLKLYSESQNIKSPEPTRQAIAKAASDKAYHALILAEKALDLDADVKSWDQKIELKNEQESTSFELTNLRDKVALLEEKAEIQNQAEIERKNGSLSVEMKALKSTVVFFPENRATIMRKFEDNLNSLASSLKANPKLKVTLVGHADHTGSPSKNNHIAEARAEEVGLWLRTKGVPSEQIVTDSRGDSQATADARDPADRQLDRRVDAYITSQSPSESLSGR